MSCSPVKISGQGASTTNTPEGSPILIANLKADRQSASDWLFSKCYTLDSTSIIYPERYAGKNSVIRNEQGLNLQPFPGGDEAACGSDNQTTIQALQ